MAIQTRLIFSLAFLSLIFQVFLWQVEIRYWPVSGDEQFYFMCAGQIHALFSENIAGDHSAITTHLNAIISHGWFLPGMSILLQPALLFNLELPYIRLYMLLLNFIFTLVIALRLAKHLPAPTGLVWLAIMLLSPATILFASTLWGEALAGKLYLLLLIEIYLALDSKKKKNAGFAVATGLALGVIIYIRPNFIILSPLLVMGVFYYQWQSVNFVQAWTYTSRFGLVAALTTCMTLLPWQFMMYQKFGAFFMTTTSIELNAIIAYTDKTYPSQLPAGYDIFMYRVSPVMDELDARAKSTGKNYGTVLRDERKRVLRTLTLKRYIDVTKNNLFDFFLNENEMLFRFQRFASDSSIKKTLYRTLRKLNTLVWYSLLACTLLLLLVSTGSSMGRWLSILAKISLVLLSTQCFMSLSGTRYYVELIPLMALLAALYAGVYCETNHKDK